MKNTFLFILLLHFQLIGVGQNVHQNGTAITLSSFNGGNTALVLNDIYFDLGKWTLRPESKPTLDSLVSFLNTHDSLVIEVGNHLSHVSGQMCYSPSTKRASSITNYLIEQGIDPERVVAKGYGDTTPFVVPKGNEHFKKGTVLHEKFIFELKSEELRETANQMNRRTEIKILRMDFVPSSGSKN